MPADRLAAVARDIAALAAPDRRAIFAALDAADRDRLHLAMRERRAAPAPRPTAAREHSRWFDDLAAAARRDEGAMTASARKALLDALGTRDDSPPRLPGRTLLQAAGGLLAAAR